MGKSKETTSQTSSQQYTPTPEETRLNQLDVQLREGTQQGLIGTQNAGLALIQQLLQGGNLPGFLSDLAGGISPEVTNDIVNQSIQDIQPYFQQSGLLDSGVNASISARTAGDIRNQAAQYNLSNKLNLLNLALSGQSAVQAPILSASESLGNRLSGLRTGNFSGTTTTYGGNPFLRSFQSSFGAGLGQGASAGVFGAGANLFRRPTAVAASSGGPSLTTV